jgi:flavin prenyltransferase
MNGQNVFPISFGQRDAVASNATVCVRRKKFIVAMTGATGAILGIKLLILLRRLHVETHLIMSHWAEQTIKYETDYTPANVRALADHVYSIHDQAAPISNGSFHSDGMIIIPCSVKTLAGINAGYCNDPISRAADVMLKERRRLVLALRETPFSEIHIRNMLDTTKPVQSSARRFLHSIPSWLRSMICAIRCWEGSWTCLTLIRVGSHDGMALRRID